MPELLFHGAAREVTGSMHMVRVDDQWVALDCGLFQGKRSESEAKNPGVTSRVMYVPPPVNRPSPMGPGKSWRMMALGSLAICRRNALLTAWMMFMVGIGGVSRAWGRELL